ncbi:MAG: ribosome-recycling factor [Bacteroidales bacterium]|nr:ribosome-recycling factor [Bacteroidales bacterium]
MAKSAMNCINDVVQSMQNIIDDLETEFQLINSIKASPGMLDVIEIDLYGVTSPLGQICNITSPDSRQIIIHPWDKEMIPFIEKVITDANLGFTPQNDGVRINIQIPSPTEEQLNALLEKSKEKMETAISAINEIAEIALNETIKNIDNQELFKTEVHKFSDSFTQKIGIFYEQKRMQLLNSKK